MLEVTVTAHDLLAFQWEILDGEKFVAGGSALTRAAAKLAGESTMFKIWATGTFGNEQPW
jgi:hypothetical protein